jgi:hypothetical protein
MKKLLVFLFLLSSVSFVGCDNKPETKVEEPITEAPAVIDESDATKVKEPTSSPITNPDISNISTTAPETVVTPKTEESENNDKK